MAQKHTRRLLMASVVSVILCLTMLIGTTFAWFTDEVTSGKNTIVAGKLDIAFSYRNASMETFEEITKETDDLVTDKDGGEIKWEPGAASVTYLKIENAGNLAFKYNLSVKANDIDTGDDGAALSKVLKTAVVELSEAEAEVGKFNTRSAAIDAAEAADAKSVLTYVKNGKMDANAKAEYLAMIIYFPREIGNVYDGKIYNLKDSEISLATNFNLNIFATQLEDESDAFNNNYDKEAPFAFNGGNHTIDLDKTPVEASGWDAAIFAKDGAKVTINGNGNVHAVGDAAGTEDEYAMAVWAKGEDAEVIINGGNFTNEAKNGDDHYDLIYASKGGNIVINGGTFKSVTPQWTLNVRDADYTSGASSITVKGGSFYMYNPAMSYTEPNGPVSYVAEGYQVIQKGDWYTVVKGNAQTFTGNGTYEVHGTFKGENPNDMVIKAIGEGVIVNITGGEYDGGKDGNNVCVAAANGAVVNITNGKFTVGNDAKGEGNSVIYSQGGNVNIYGGEFYTDTYADYGKKWYYVLNQNNGNPGTITVYGGSFRDYNPAEGDDNLGGSFVADGYKVVADTAREPGHTWYTVVRE